MIKTTALATLVAGTLDIGVAMVETALSGKPIAGMLRSVASGPFPAAPDWGLGGAALGLLVHFALMAVMAAVFVLAYRRIAAIRAHPLTAGALYGIALWLVMYGLVLPLRFGAEFPAPDPIAIARQVAVHVGVVGMVIAALTHRTLGKRTTPATD